jgi:hypothetical protein
MINPDEVIKSWESLQNLLQDIAQGIARTGWAWRGEGKSYCEHKSKIDRCLDPVEPKLTLEHRLRIERSVLQRFREHAPNNLSAIEREYLQSWWPQLVVMQHYFAPTRLLDWTRSVWIAVFFAVSASWTKNSTVYGFNRRALEDKFEHTYKGELPGLVRGRPGDRGKDFSTEDWDCATQNDRLFKWDEVKDLSNWIITYYSRLPHFPRLVAQQGLFTFASRPCLDHWDWIVSFLDDKDSFMITIAHEAKLEILLGLDAMGVNGATLFPGADGVGRYIEAFARTWPQTDRM